MTSGNRPLDQHVRANGLGVVFAAETGFKKTVVGGLAAPLLAEAANGAGRINTAVSDTLQGVRSTQDQVELSAAGRRRNVAGAFSAGARTRGRLLLVDDVFTTRATTSACAAALLDAGVAEVRAVTLCRTC